MAFWERATIRVHGWPCFTPFCQTRDPFTSTASVGGFARRHERLTHGESKSKGDLLRKWAVFLCLWVAQAQPSLFGRPTVGLPPQGPGHGAQCIGQHNGVHMLCLCGWEKPLNTHTRRRASLVWAGCECSPQGTLAALVAALVDTGCDSCALDHSAVALWAHWVCALCQTIHHIQPQTSCLALQSYLL